MKPTSKLFSLALTLGLSSLGPHGQATAESAADFYKGKTITAVSQSAEDASITVFSRIIARHLEKHTGASVVVKPMPGGGGRLARNHLYAAKPDGLTVVLVMHGPKLITDGLFKLQGVRYDWSKFEPLGKTIAANAIVFVAKNSPWKTPKDPANDEFNYGETSPFYGPLFAEALGWEKMTVIPGYRGTTSRAVAISRGEIQAGTGGMETVSANPDLIKPLVFSVPDKAFPDVLSVRQSMAPGREKWVQYIEGWSDVMYVSLAPSGIPEDRAAFLEEALKKTWADPAFRKDLEKVKESAAAEFVTRKKLKSFMNSLGKLSQKDIDEMKYVVREKYKKK